jgi:hypothetical protein
MVIETGHRAQDNGCYGTSVSWHVGNIKETGSAYRIFMQKPTKKNQILRPGEVSSWVEMVHDCVRWLIFMLMFDYRLFYQGR